MKPHILDIISSVILPDDIFFSMKHFVLTIQLYPYFIADVTYPLLAW